MIIYLAAAFDRKLELRAHREALLGMGHEVQSSWLDSEVAIDSLMSTVQKREAARVCSKEVMECDLLILFSEPPNASVRSSGGRHVEFGMAYSGGSFVYTVGPVENIFHTVESVQNFETWHDCLEHLVTP